MGRKLTKSYQVAPPNGVATQSLATSFITNPTEILGFDNLVYQIVINTTNSVGTFAVQTSNDYALQDGVVINPGNWNTLSLGGGVPFANAANDIIGIYITEMGATAVRLVYTSTTAGTGTCVVNLTAKQIGG